MAHGSITDENIPHPTQSELIRRPDPTGDLPATVTEMLLRLADVQDKGPIFLNAQLEPREWSFARIVEQSKRMAAHLHAHGVRPRDRVALIISDSEEFVPAFFGAMLAGAIPVPLSLPISVRALASYNEHCKRVLGTAQCTTVIVDELISSVAASAWQDLPAITQVIRVESVPKTGPGTTEIFAPQPSDTCFLQFTSGSTSAPKGVIVTHANLIANSYAIVKGWLDAGPDDVGVSWLPLFHDMGLIGVVIAPLLIGLRVVFIPTMSFVRRPAVWMKVVHDYRGTMTISPNFGFALAVRRARDVDQLDLSCLRVIGCGAEPINPRTLESFTECHAPAGLRRDVISPLYGLAEATLLASCRRVGEGYRTIEIDRTIYEEERRAVPLAQADDGAGLRLVGCGRAMEGHEIRIGSPEQAPLPDGHVGEVLLRGPSCTPGYIGIDSPPSEYLATGDLGFMLDQDLFIAGRKKDLIIINGRNLQPQAIEWEVEQITGVRRGAVVAFSVTGAEREELVVLAESTEQNPKLPLEIKRRLAETLGVPVQTAHILSPGTIPKTSSGKLQRSKAREQWLRGTLSIGDDRDPQGRVSS